MSVRRAYLDPAPGELRGVVTLDGRPERLILEREADPAVQRLGARAVGRVRQLNRTLATAFIDLGAGPDGVLPLKGDGPRLTEGAAVAVEVMAEARAEKGPVVRFEAFAEGAPRLLAAAPPLAERLSGWAPGEIIEGAAARDLADLAEEEALAVLHPLPGGGTLAIEPTRALVAVDVDLGARAGEGGRATRAANLAAVAEAARLLRLKGLGGLVVFDLAGKGQDGAALAAAAKAAFEPDQPGVAIGPVSRFGTFDLAVPHRGTPVGERLLGPDGGLSDLTLALRLLRAVERAGRADPGGRIEGLAHPGVIAAAAPYLSAVTDRLGPRIALRPTEGRPRGHIEARGA